MKNFGKYGLRIEYDADEEMYDIYTTCDDGSPDTLVNSFKNKEDAIEWTDMMESK